MSNFNRPPRKRYPKTSFKPIEKPDDSSFEMNRLVLSGLSYSRVADLYKTNPGRVGQHVAAARKYLRENAQ